jgi:hypothetical protein
LAVPREPQPVKLFLGIIYREGVDLSILRSRLEEIWGPTDFLSPPCPFDLTRYYEKEMGLGLKRVFWSFSRLIDPGELASIKVRTNRLEEEFSQEGKRSVNLDPGYLDFFKIVLASGKFSGQKIYLGQGIYADPTLYYHRGWKAYDWGFPDFRGGLYNRVFDRIRDIYKRQIREKAHSESHSGKGQSPT